MAEATPLLDVESLSIRFGPSAPALVDNLSFSLKPGETLCLVGESGCGKSLTALALMGLLPTRAQPSGRARFEGRDLLTLPARQMQDLRGDRMAMIFQEPMTSLNPAFRIGDQIGESIVRHRGASRSEARKLALDMLRKVRIPAAEKRLDAYPHQLSGGMRQRIMIAVALVNEPDLLIADEPTTALDVTIQAQILALMRELQRAAGMAMILVTHDLGVVAEVADRVAVMYAGRIVETGTARDLFDDPQHPYTLGLIGSLPSLGRREGRLATIPGSVPPPDRFPAGCRFATRCPFADARCWTETPPLTGIGAAGHRAACFKAPIEANAGGLAA
ncbi:ABC transporter ATP-binding protein [Rhodomicrobium sp. R_RK_3]|nr:ABC transporter ATP-binding protein [Rhodomicrobium sp. R_RK_3]